MQWLTSFFKLLQLRKYYFFNSLTRTEVGIFHCFLNGPRVLVDLLLLFRQFLHFVYAKLKDSKKRSHHFASL